MQIFFQKKINYNTDRDNQEPDPCYVYLYFGFDFTDPSVSEVTWSVAQ